MNNIQSTTPSFLIAAPTSGSGKTTVARGLMAALVRRGLRVQPFKCGPDYIDTKFHSRVCGRPSVNLDTFMATPSHVRDLYAHYGQGADVCVMEGMMGLYDGWRRAEGSSAEIAGLLGLPVVMVVQARSAAYSMAPLLHGFRTFRPDVRQAGVIFNQVGSVRHRRMLLEACADAGLPCLGFLPRDAEVEQGSRYLGLDFSHDRGAEALDHLVSLVEDNIDVDRLLTLHGDALPCPTALSRTRDDWHSVVLRDDDNFAFIYAEHLDILARHGRVTFINPADDRHLPPDTTFLYLPGGYPERHAAELTRSRRLMESIRQYIADGGRALAECGGMIYLSQGIWMDGQTQPVPMCGVLPFNISARQQDRHLSLGYRQLTYSGQSLRGHEFHYTQFAPGQSLPPSAVQVLDAQGQPVPTPIFRHRNLLASYTHLYWGETDLRLLLH